MSEGYDPVAWERLRRQWGLTVLTAVSVAIVGYVFLSDWWTRRHGIQWTVTAGVVLTYELWLLWRYLDQNRCESAGLLLDSLGIATAATLARGLLTAAVAGFIVLPEPTGQTAWLPAVLYVVAVALDRVDGRLARQYGETTMLGAKLDLEFDGLSLLVAGLLGIVYGTLPLWYLAVGLARPAFVIGRSLHRRRGGAVGSIPPSTVRRPLTGVQMFVCSVALVPIVPSTVSIALATVAMIPFVCVFARDFHSVVQGA
ncbi:CDP-alcohol phosphatidyltransferase family protein [Halococcus dombrowskii]|uniref:CDP-alcohol phosphatidyltransferase family protein n=1 Tax=Halococcus dombrowskii TaxID=179637 RepID=A0AAV3SCL6_HALDO|nr:CDP-alcohol phosphatidyltransferase family protein [Halococcus dombrowskii]UOO95119.1 CDP-alcohol phosphatidyltransferase family protein [Halococcus dombrowskii]